MSSLAGATASDANTAPSSTVATSSAVMIALNNGNIAAPPTSESGIPSTISLHTPELVKIRQQGKDSAMQLGPLKGKAAFNVKRDLLVEKLCGVLGFNGTDSTIAVTEKMKYLPDNSKVSKGHFEAALTRLLNTQWEEMIRSNKPDQK